MNQSAEHGDGHVSQAACREVTVSYRSHGCNHARVIRRLTDGPNKIMIASVRKSPRRNGRCCLRL